MAHERSFERTRLAAGLTLEEMSQAIGAEPSTVLAFEEDPDEAPVWLAKAYLAEAAKFRGIQGNSPYHRLLPVIRRLVSVVEHLSKSEDPKSKICQHRNVLRRLVRKPRLAMYGPFDAGKSHFLNFLLGAEVLPSAFQPATKLVTIVAHSTHKPAWLHDQVVILPGNWSPQRLAETSTAPEDVVVIGALRELEVLGVHQRGQTQSSDTPGTAFVFLDFPLLEAITLIDLPGFSSGQAADEESRQALEIADAMVFMTTAAGFLKEPCIARFNEALHLIPRMSVEGHVQAALHNIAIVASHAVVGHDQMAGILTKGMRLIWESSRGEIARRTYPIGIPMHSHQLEERLFMFLSEDPLKALRLRSDMQAMIFERLPAFYFHASNFALRKLKSDCDRGVLAHISDFESELLGAVEPNISSVISVYTTLQAGNGRDAGSVDW